MSGFSLRSVKGLSLAHLPQDPSPFSSLSQLKAPTSTASQSLGKVGGHGFSQALPSGGSSPCTCSGLRPCISSSGGGGPSKAAFDFSVVSASWGVPQAQDSKPKDGQTHCQLVDHRARHGVARTTAGCWRDGSAVKNEGITLAHDLSWEGAPLQENEVAGDIARPVRKQRMTEASVRLPFSFLFSPVPHSMDCRCLYSG